EAEARDVVFILWALRLMAAVVAVPMVIGHASAKVRHTKYGAHTGQNFIPPAGCAAPWAGRRPCSPARLPGPARCRRRPARAGGRSPPAPAPRGRRRRR